VTSYSLPLREIDTVQGDEGSDGGYVPNALEVVVRKRHLHMLEVRGGGCWGGGSSCFSWGGARGRGGGGGKVQTASAGGGGWEGVGGEW